MINDPGPSWCLVGGTYYRAVCTESFNFLRGFDGISSVRARLRTVKSVNINSRYTRVCHPVKRRPRRKDQLVRVRSLQAWGRIERLLE
jgi:hypothetical protein